MANPIEASLVYEPPRTQPLSSGIRAVVQRARRAPVLGRRDRARPPGRSPGKQPNKLKLAGQVLEDGMPVEGRRDQPARDRPLTADETDEEGEFLVQFGAERCIQPPMLTTPSRQMHVTSLDIE